MRSAFAPGLPDRLGVAVSGGGDSLAMLHLLDDWRKGGGPALVVVTVDHGLRPEAAAEAAEVGRIAAGMGLDHDVLRWDGGAAAGGNLADRARRARYASIADWARARGITTVALGHTADDQAETVLMRLARGSGVDGLAAMAQQRAYLGVTWVRPLLWARRADLRDWLKARTLPWVDDPTNDDPAFDRVRMRQALPVLAALGITPEGLIATAQRLALAREALGAAARDLAREAVTFEAGDVILDRERLEAAPFETAMRIFAHALVRVSSADYRPRFASLTAAWASALAGRRITLHGCMVAPRRGGLRVLREAQAVAHHEVAADAVWDGRWRLHGPGAPGYTVRALGAEGLSLCGEWRKAGVLRASLLASPAVWNGPDLVAAPLAGRSNGWRAELLHDRHDFLEKLIVH